MKKVKEEIFKDFGMIFDKIMFKSITQVLLGYLFLVIIIVLSTISKLSSIFVNQKTFTEFELFVTFAIGVFALVSVGFLILYKMRKYYFLSIIAFAWGATGVKLPFLDDWMPISCGIIAVLASINIGYIILQYLYPKDFSKLCAKHKSKSNKKKK